MSLISKKTHCFHCEHGEMIREGNEIFYRYVCSTCGAYSEGTMYGADTQYHHPKEKDKELS